MNCLVTGGAGFIGSNLALHLEALGHTVTVVDNLFSGSRENLAGFRGRFLQGDVSHPVTLGVIGSKFDAIFHQAAITDPRHPDDQETLRQNVEGFRLMLALAANQGAKFIYASTASLYGNGPSPQKEDQPKELLSAYATSKLIQDEMASHHFGELHVVGLRYFNVFGPREAHKGQPASMVFHLARQMRAGRRPRVFTAGEQQRDHIYVKDCVAANLAALSAPSGVYNVGTGVGTSFNELVQRLNEALGTSLAPDYFDMPFDSRTYQSHTQADIRRAVKYLGFHASYDLRQALAEYTPVIS